MGLYQARRGGVGAPRSAEPLPSSVALALVQGCESSRSWGPGGPPAGAATIYIPGSGRMSNTSLDVKAGGVGIRVPGAHLVLSGAQDVFQDAPDARFTTFGCHGV